MPGEPLPSHDVAASSRPDTVVKSPGTTMELAYRDEVWRKLLHLFALSIPIGYHFVPRLVAILIPLGCCVASVFIDLARIRGWAVQRFWRRLTEPIVRPKERWSFTGASHILASGWLCPLLFSVPAAATGMSTIILGDVAAALIGRRWGRHRYLNNRSYEGSAGFLAAAIIGSLLIPGVPTGIALSAAFLATVVEGLSQRIDDNLTVPLIVGLYVHLALRLL